MRVTMKDVRFLVRNVRYIYIYIYICNCTIAPWTRNSRKVNYKKTFKGENNTYRRDVGLAKSACVGSHKTSALTSADRTGLSSTSPTLLPTEAYLAGAACTFYPRENFIRGRSTLRNKLVPSPTIASTHQTRLIYVDCAHRLSLIDYNLV